MSNVDNRGFFQLLIFEVKSIGTDTRASDMRRLKNSVIEKIKAMETGAEVREIVNKSLAEKVEELEKQVDLYINKRIDLCPHCQCSELYVKERVAVNQQAKVDKLEAEKKELVEALEKSVEYLKQGKAQFAPHTTNSFVDDFIEKWEAKIKSEARDEK